MVPPLYLCVALGFVLGAPAPVMVPYESCVRRLRDAGGKRRSAVKQIVLPTSLRWLALLLLGVGSGCSDEACEPVVVHTIDPVRACYITTPEAPEIEQCLDEPEKGMTAECVVSPDGAVGVVMRNTAAVLRSDTWRLGAAVSEQERARCEQALDEIGWPAADNECPEP